jgi:Fe-S-cluster containining protein
MKIRNIFHLKSYLFEKDQCFIPKCKAKCCANAPLPEGFAEKMKGCASRDIYYAVNIGKNDSRDSFNSVIFNTRPLPLVPIGHASKSSDMLYHFNEKFAKELGIKSRDEAVKRLMELEAQGGYNYCPFLNEYGRCQVYAGRPPICREFGTAPGIINICPDKASRWEIIKYNLKDISFKDFILFYKNLIANAFKKLQKS